jgi:hypothetical protein
MTRVSDERFGSWVSEALVHVNGNRHGPDASPMPAADPATMLLAYTNALAAGDPESARTILAALDPAQTGAVLSTFAAWRPYTDPKSGRAGFISDGGLVRYEQPTAAEGHANAHDKTITDALAADHGDELKDPETRRTVGAKVKAVREAVYGWMVRQTPLVWELVSNIADTPDDFKKFGFAPTMSGTGQATHSDPVKGAIGISGHLAVNIASRVLSGVVQYVKAKRAGRATGMADADPAAALAELFAVVNKAVGSDVFVTDPAEVAKRVGGKTALAEDVHVNTARPVSINSDQSGEPASDEVALAGKDGKALAKLIRESKADGVQTLHRLTLDALKGYRGGRLLFGPSEVDKLADALAATNATADLLGRSRVREMHDRATTHGGLHRFADVSLSTFADGFPGIMATPHDALAYFTGLFPTLAVDPQRWEGEQRRRAFTLAEGANRALTRRVQELIAKSMEENESVADATARIRDALSDVGVTPRNPQYAEMVFRTNAMDSFQTGMWEEGNAGDVADVFPAWQYLGIDDERAGEDHRPKFDRFYPRTAAFAQVRGKRPYNCRCGMRWVDQFEWEDIQRAGGQTERHW